MKFSNHLILIAIILSSYTLRANGETHQARNLAEFLKQFHANPAMVLEQLPPKSQSTPLFSKDTINSNEFITLKNSQKTKQNFCKTINGITHCLNDSSLEGKTSFIYDDLAEYLVDSDFSHLKKLHNIEQSIRDENGNLSGRLDEQPWSDDYWPIAQGILGFRYADYDIKYSTGWKNVYDTHLVTLPASKYIEENKVDLLSPSEKYDLLIGDENFTLTKAMWAAGKAYWTPEKDVETWMGICHGWAPAAYMVPRPQNAITVTAADGKTPITFYPADIKSLASLLWANAPYDTKFIGGRCSTKNPKKDENGRIQDKDCFDSNPATWHKVVVNQIKKGPEGRSFVLDAAYDYEVWNQPVYAYSYRYFNPLTSEESNTWSDETVLLKIEDYTNDIFKKYRSKDTEYIIGVEMIVEYMKETRPEQNESDDPSYDEIGKVIYRYDLEVAFDGEIIGGEWYSNKHPDFLWTPEKNARPQTNLDKTLTTVSMTTEYTPEEFKKAALYSSSYVSSPSSNGIPLAKVVEELIRLSNEKE